MPYRTQLCTTVDDLDVLSWERFARQPYIGLDWRHLQAIETSRINDVHPYYLTVYWDDEAVGIAYFFVFNLDISGLSDDVPPSIRHTLKTWNPYFLTFRVVECGFISSVGEGLGYREDHAAPFFAELSAAMEAVGREENADFVLLRDIPYQKSAAMSAGLGDGYAAFLGYPTARMAIRWRSFDEYLGALNRQQRRNMRKTLAAIESSDISVEYLQNFDQHADRLEQLWRQVSCKAASYEHERLTSRYFREMNRSLGNDSSVIALTLGGEIVAAAFCLLGQEVFSFLHAGIDYAYNAQYQLYFNLNVCCIKEAIRRQIPVADFGLTTYFYKCKIGCELEPLVYFVRHLKDPELTPSLAHALRSGIPQPENRHRPFKGQDIEHRLQLPNLDVALRAEQLPKQKDVFAKAHQYVRMGKLRLAELYSFFPPFESAQDGVIEHQGREVILLGTNAYLGLSNHPEVKTAAAAAIEKYGTGCSGSPVLNGTLDLHEQLIREIAEFTGKEDAIILGTGYQANVAVLTGILGRGDAVVVDTLDHASLIDGARFSRSKIITYRHNDEASLDKTLSIAPDRAKLVVIDSVFSMEGTIIDLPAILEVCKTHGARVLIDEAHSLGVLGPEGRGVAAQYGLTDDVDLIMGTFSKSFGAVGGFIAGEARVIDYLRHVCRPHLFSASLPPPVVATVLASLLIVKTGDRLREKVLGNAKYMSEKLQQLGFEAPFRGTAIVPIHCGNELLALALYQKLLKEGVFVNPVLSPAVPKGKELLRTSYMATHTRHMLDRALEVFSGARTDTFPIDNSCKGESDVKSQSKRAATEVAGDHHRCELDLRL